MKFIQLLTALALVATSSVAYASRVSRKKGVEMDVLEKVKSSCKQGEDDAKWAVDDLFNNDCTNALDRRFTQDVNSMRDKQFSTARNWKQRQYNKCGRDAIKKELDRVGKKCRDSSHAAKDCNELGEIAAEDIVKDSGVCSSHNGYNASHNNLKKFRRECRSVAYGRCEEYITKAFDKCSGNRYSLTTSKQSQLQNQCKDTVDRMTDNRYEVEVLDQYLEKKIGRTPEEEEEAKKFCASQNTERSCEGGGIHRGGVVCLWFSHREKDQCVFNSLVGDLYPGWSSSDEDDEKAKQKCAEHLFDSTCWGYGCYWVANGNEYGGQCTFEPDPDEDEANYLDFEGTFLESEHTPQCEGRMDTKQDCANFCRKDKGHWGWHWSYNRDCYTCKCDDGTKCKTLRK